MQDEPQRPGPDRAGPDPLPSDLFAHSLGLSPANTPAPANVPVPHDPSPPQRKPRRSSRRGRRGRLALAAVGVVALAAAGTAVGFAVTGDGSPDGGPSGGVAASRAASPSPSATSAPAAAAAWLSLNIRPPRQIVTTGAELAQDLQTAGVAADTVGIDDMLPLGAVVVRIADAGTAPEAVTAVVPSGRSLVPLARFDGGTGSGTVTVGQVVKGDPEAVGAQLDAAAGIATAACQGLAANAAVTITDGVQPVFEAGDLDVRASTMLAVIARTQSVEVVAAPQDAAERAAGRPVREIVVRVDDADALRTTAAAARPPYLAVVADPPADLDVPDGSLLLTWVPNAAATLPTS